MKELDLTKGNVTKVLIQFALPFMLANVLQALYGATDLFVVGQYDDAASVSAVGIGSQAMHTITAIILGLTTGVTVLIGMGTGAKDFRKVAQTIGSAIWLFAGIGLLMTVLMAGFYQSITTLMNTPPEAIRDTENYILIGSLGIPFIIGYNVVCGILRGLGDSKTPLYFVAIACFINIVLDFLLIGGFHLRAAGAAIATTVSQGVSFLSALWFLRRKGFSFEFTRKDIRPNRRLSTNILKLGTPIALQDTLIHFTFIIITVIINRMGVAASAGVGVVEKLIVFAMLSPIAISSAVAAMTAQNYGAMLLDRMKRCLSVGIRLCLVFGVAFWIYCQFLPHTLIGIFTNDTEVIRIASTYLQSYSMDCVLVSFVFSYNSYFSGQGNTVFPMIHSLIASFFFRVPLSGWFSTMTNSSLYLMGCAAPISTLASVIMCVWYLRKKYHTVQIL